VTEEGKGMLLHVRSWFCLVLKRRKEHLLQRHHYLTISALAGDGPDADSLYGPRVSARRIAVKAVWERWMLFIECRIMGRAEPGTRNRLRVLNAIYETTATELGAHSFEHRPTYHRDSVNRMDKQIKQSRGTKAQRRASRIRSLTQGHAAVSHESSLTTLGSRSFATAGTRATARSGSSHPTALSLRTPCNRGWTPVGIAGPRPRAPPYDPLRPRQRRRPPRSAARAPLPVLGPDEMERTRSAWNSIQGAIAISLKLRRPQAKKHRDAGPRRPRTTNPGSRRRPDGARATASAPAALLAGADHFPSRPNSSYAPARVAL
jgi:hypothetical protein